MTAKLVSEFVGTAAFCFVGIGSIFAATSMHVTDPGSALLIAALAHGLGIGMMVTAVGHISGGVLNPAVTIAAWATKQKSTVESALFIAVQLVGGVVGALAARWAFPGGENWGAKATPLISDVVGTWRGVGVEALLTFILVWIVFSTALDRDGTWFRIAGLPIGFIVAVDVLVGAPITGAAMNPARVFGPALAFNEWHTTQWVYWVGSIAGAVAAGVLYMQVVRPRSHGAPQPKTL